MNIQLSYVDNNDNDDISSDNSHDGDHNYKAYNVMIETWLFTL